MATTPSGGLYRVLDDERINARADFFQGLGQSISGSWAARVGTMIASDSETENYDWLGTTPQLQQWDGEAVAKQLKTYSYTLTNQEFEATLGIRKSDIRRDKTGQIRRRIGDLGVKAGDHWNKLAATVLGDGESTTCYDGQFFFDTDHAESGSNQTNDLTATEVPSANAASTTVLTATEAAGIIFESVAHMMTLKDDQGDPINGNARNWVFVVGTAGLWKGLSQAIGLDSLTSGATNPVRGLQSEGFNVSAILEPRLSAKTTKVYALNVDAGNVGPLILQDEVGVTVEEEDPGITSKNINVMASATRNVGYGLWQKAAVITIS